MQFLLSDFVWINLHNDLNTIFVGHQCEIQDQPYSNNNKSFKIECITQKSHFLLKFNKIKVSWQKSNIRNGVSLLSLLLHTPS